VSASDSNGRTIFIADAHRDDGKRFVVRADEKLTAFIELESAVRDAQSIFLRVNRTVLHRFQDFFKLVLQSRWRANHQHPGMSGIRDWIGSFTSEYK
jgi:hypothetical protein